MVAQPICQIITPVGMLGYGFDEALTAYELARLVPNGIPTAIILDSGSTDSGPEKLALGSMSNGRSSYYNDLSKMLRLVHTFRVPLIFGSAGGDGADEHVKVMEEIVNEISAEEQNKDYRLKTISIFSSIDKTTVLKRLKAGRVTGCGTCVPDLTETDVESSPRIVAQIGPEPYIDAMEANPDFDIIIGGRSYDPAPYAGYCAYQLGRQFPQLSSADIQERYGGFTHMGKIMECGGQCAKPKSHGAVATMYASGVFDVRPTALGATCTPLTVAAHTLYENTRPDLLRGPGGSLHLSDCKYEQLKDSLSVRVSGSKYISSREDGLPYCFKLEGARTIGYRSMFMGSITDYILIRQLEDLIPRARNYVTQQHPYITGQWDLGFHIYGKGQATPSGPAQIFLVVESVAPTQQLANSIASKARIGMIHAAYPGQKATAGNFGFGIGGRMEFELGPCAQFSVYHLMELDPGEERLTREKKTGNKIRSLLHASVATIGKGPATVASDDFKASIALRQHTFPQPGFDNATYVPPQEVKIMTNPKLLTDIALILRSKNAGPYEITIDVMFVSEEAYRWTKASSVLSRENVAKALEVEQKDIVWMGFFEPARAFKVTIPRFRNGKKASAGGFMENDIHGSQRHNGLANLKLGEFSSSTKPIAAPLNAFRDQPLYSLLGAVGALLGVGIIAAAKRFISQRRSA